MLLNKINISVASVYLRSSTERCGYDWIKTIDSDAIPTYNFYRVRRRNNCLLCHVFSHLRFVELVHFRLWTNLLLCTALPIWSNLNSISPQQTLEFQIHLPAHTQTTLLYTEKVSPFHSLCVKSGTEDIFVAFSSMDNIFCYIKQYGKMITSVVIAGAKNILEQGNTIFSWR